MSICWLEDIFIEYEPTDTGKQYYLVVGGYRYKLVWEVLDESFMCKLFNVK